MNTPILNEYLLTHIPYRLQAIDGFRWACETILIKPQTQSVELIIDGRIEIKSKEYRFITNPMVEVGSIYCRVLLEILGVGLNSTKNHLIERPIGSIKPDDITLLNFGLNRLSVDKVVSVPIETSENIERACIAAIVTADKAVAHLTLGPTTKLDLQDLYTSSRVVPYLIIKYLYQALDLPEPNYRISGK
jgi:hypothetical protein